MKQRLHVHGIRLDDTVFAHRDGRWFEIDSPSAARRFLGSTPAPVLVVPADLEVGAGVRDLKRALDGGAWWATLDPSACTGRRGLKPDPKKFLYSLPDLQRTGALLSLADGAFLFDDPTAYLRSKLDDSLRAQLVSLLFLWSMQEAKIKAGPDTFFAGRLVEEYQPVPETRSFYRVIYSAQKVAESYVTGAQYSPASDNERCALILGLWLFAGGSIDHDKVMKKLTRVIRKISKNPEAYEPSFDKGATRMKREHILSVLTRLFGSGVESRYVPEVEMLKVASYDSRLVLEDPHFSALGSGTVKVSKKDLAGLGPDRREMLPVGGLVPALWLGRYDADGNRVVSVSLARKVDVWMGLYDLLEGSGWVDAKVLEVVNGGLLLDVSGIEGFLPASLVDRRVHAGDIDDLVGSVVPVAPVRLDASTLRTVVSHREGETRREAERELERRAAEFDRVSVGQVIEGTVSSWVNFGMFVDIGGLDGLCHISNLDGMEKGSIPVGEKLKVEVLEVDRYAQRVSLRPVL